MAEALGVFASGVAVAQVAGTVGAAALKLKKLWEEVRDVPESIRDLLEQIDCLDPALWEAERNLARNDLPPLLWSGDVAQRSTTYCRKALTRLTELVDDLDALLHRSPNRAQRRRDRLAMKVACVKIILRKDELVSLERRLEAAVRMLCTAQQGYVMQVIRHTPFPNYWVSSAETAAGYSAILNHQPDIIVGKLISRIGTNRSPWAEMPADGEIQPTEKSRISENPPDTQPNSRIIMTKNDAVSTTRLGPPTRLGGLACQSFPDGFSVHAQAPRWFAATTTWAWNINLRKSYNGWEFHLRSYSIRPYNAPVFQAIYHSDLCELQNMFALGEASPFDCGEDGRPLLAVSDSLLINFQPLLSIIASPTTETQIIQESTKFLIFWQQRLQ